MRYLERPAGQRGDIDARRVIEQSFRARPRRVATHDSGRLSHSSSNPYSFVVMEKSRPLRAARADSAWPHPRLADDLQTGKTNGESFAAWPLHQRFGGGKSLPLRCRRSSVPSTHLRIVQVSARGGRAVRATRPQRRRQRESRALPAGTSGSWHAQDDIGHRSATRRARACGRRTRNLPGSKPPPKDSDRADHAARPNSR